MSDTTLPPQETQEEFAVRVTAFREELKALYLKHGHTGVVIVTTGGGNLFSWIGLSVGGALDVMSNTRRTLCEIASKEI